MRKIYWKKHVNGCNLSYSVWLDDTNLAYGIGFEEDAELTCQVARLALENCGIKVLNSFDSQNSVLVRNILDRL